MNGKLCSKCKTEISLSYNAYCYTCFRVMMGRSKEPKFRRDPDNKLCSKCKKNPRQTNHNYCRACQRGVNEIWIQKHGGHWESKTPEQKRRANVRRYIKTLIERGKIQPKPCAICGKEQVEIHHWDYERMTLNVDWFCHDHHMTAERLKKQNLTKEQIVAYLLNQHGSSAPIATAPPDSAGPLRSV